MTATQENRSVEAAASGAGPLRLAPREAAHADNPASRRVLEKCGFRRAGGYPLHCLARDAEVTVDNMILTRADWERRR